MNRLILRSLICGIIISVSNFLWMYYAGNDDLDEPSTLQIIQLFLIGFIYGTVLTLSDKKPFNRKKFWFILLSGFLYIPVAFSSNGADGYFLTVLFTYCLVSGIGALVLFLFYFALMDDTLRFTKGMFLSFLLGFIAGIIPSLWRTKANQGVVHDFDEIGSMMIIFMIWQPLFALAVTLSRKKIFKNSEQSRN